jgi:hypothetical protein
MCYQEYFPTKHIHSSLQHDEVDTKSYSVAEGVYCPLIFDGLSCWNYTPAGDTAFLPCPYFMAGFDPRRKSTAICCYKQPMRVHRGTSADYVTFSMEQSATCKVEQSGENALITFLASYEIQSAIITGALATTGLYLEYSELTRHPINRMPN